MLLDEREGKTIPASWFQRIAKRVLERHGVRLRDEFGVRSDAVVLLARLDLAEPNPRIGIECQSWRWHATWDAQLHDARRKGMLGRVGREIIDVWWRDLSHPDRVFAEVEHLILRRHPDLSAWNRSCPDSTQTERREQDGRMSKSVVLLERRDDGVAVVTLNNGKVNALSGAVVAALHEIADDLTANPPGAVVVTGGDKIFAAGADISEFGGPDEARGITDRIHASLDAVAAIPRFVIAAVSGYALGGGCELALACDYRIAGDRAVFGQPEILLGTIPGGGGTQRLARQVGASRAKEISITGRQVKADEAFRIGLADEVVAGEALHDRALGLAAECANGAVLSQALAKQAIDRGLSTSLADGLRIERDLFVESFRTNDSQIGVKSFLEHGPGKADFTGT